MNFYCVFCVKMQLFNVRDAKVEIDVATSWYISKKFRNFEYKIS